MPWVKVPVWLLSMVRSTPAPTVVGSLPLLFPALAAGSPPPLTLAVFVTLGTAAASTETTSEIAGALLPALVEFVRVHVTVPAALPHVHPPPPADTKPSPVGKTS